MPLMGGSGETMRIEDTQEAGVLGLILYAVFCINEDDIFEFTYEALDWVMFRNWARDSAEFLVNDTAFIVYSIIIPIQIFSWLRN